MNAIIINNLNIGYSTKIGAGSVVLHSQKPKITVFGNPEKDKLNHKMYKSDHLSDSFFHNGLIIYGKKGQG